MIVSDIPRLILVLVLVGLNGFFVAAEFALVSVRRTRIEELVARGDTNAKVVRKVIKNPDHFIAATQLGITIASLGLGWVGEPALSVFIEPIVELGPERYAGIASRSVSSGIAFAVITFLHVVIGELTPKSLALQFPEKVSLTIARPTVFTATLFKPFIFLLNGAGNGLLRLFGVEPASGHQLAHSVEELRMIVAASAEGGELASTTQELLEAVFDFRNLRAQQVIIPRTELTMLQANQTLRDVINSDEDARFSKYPVYDDTPDEIVGIFHLRDCLELLAQGKLDTKVGDLARPAIFIPETTPVINVLALFREKRTHVAMVLDEFGGTAGMVTLEDTLEEIAGTLPDEYEQATPKIIRRPDNSTLVSGLTLIEDVNRFFDISIKDPNYDTIAGYIMGQLDRIPKVGDEVTVAAARFRVVAMDGKRIARLVVPSHVDTAKLTKNAKQSTIKPED